MVNLRVLGSQVRLSWSFLGVFIFMIFHMIVAELRLVSSWMENHPVSSSRVEILVLLLDLVTHLAAIFCMDCAFLSRLGVSSHPRYLSDMIVYLVLIPWQGCSWIHMVSSCQHSSSAPRHFLRLGSSGFFPSSKWELQVRFCLMLSPRILQCSEFFTVSRVLLLFMTSVVQGGGVGRHPPSLLSNHDFQEIRLVFIDSQFIWRIGKSASLLRFLFSFSRF